MTEGEARLHQIPGVMERLGVGRSKVFELIESGELRSVKIGRRRLVPESAIVDFIRTIELVGADSAQRAAPQKSKGVQPSRQEHLDASAISTPTHQGARV
jgi:excisionase family DNA binding protein